MVYSDLFVFSDLMYQDYKMKVESCTTHRVAKFVFSFFQELQSELEFIQCNARDLHQRCQALPLEVPDVERDQIKDKLERLQRDINLLDEELPRLTQPNAMGGEGASAVVALPVEVVRSKPVAHEPLENGDSDLGDSESGVSSMESFEGILRKENGQAPGENDVKENGVSEEPEERSSSEDLDGDIRPSGGMSVTPDEYQRIRMNHSEQSNEEVTIGLENGECSHDLDDESRETNDQSRDVSVPLLTVTDEDGTPAEVEFAENAPENTLDNADSESCPDQAGEFFIDDFDVYYGQAPPKIVVGPDEASARDNEFLAESEREKPAGESGTDHVENDSQNSSVLDQEPSGASDDQTGDLVLKDKVRDPQLVESAVTKITLPPHKAVNVDDLLESNFTSDLETGVLPRHSTPSELVVSIENEENAPLDEHAQKVTVEPLKDSVVAVNGEVTSPSSNDTENLPLSDEGEKRADKKLKHEPSAVSSLDSTPIELLDMSGQAGMQTGLVSSAPNEEMDKLDRLLNVTEHDSENNVRDIKEVKPQDRIASILSERRKAEEDERRRFAETSVRDTDYELFASRPLDLMDRSSPLKDLDESGNLLHEEMSLEEFLVEVEKLVEKLRSIEELITTELDSEDNVKDELAKHVVS